MTARDPSSSTDGRHARAERTREAIVDALLALLDEGDIRPSAERIAERAGISRRAIFNHFSDTEDLLATAAARQMSRVLPELGPPPTGGSAAERIEALAKGCCRIYARIAPVRRAALLVEPVSPVVAERLAVARRYHRGSIETTFEPELSACAPDDRPELAATLAAASSFSTWEELTTHQHLSPPQVERAMRRLLDGALSSRHDPSH